MANIRTPNIIKNASMISVSLGFTMVLSLLLRMYLPRVLGPEKIGQFFYAESIALIFFSFLPLGISVYISKKIPPNPSHTKKILSSILILQLVYGLFIGLALYIFLKFMGKNENITQFTMTMAAYASMMIVNREILKRTFIARNEVKIVTIINILSKVLLVILAFTFLFYSESVQSVIYSFVLSEVFGFVLLMFNFYRKGLLGSSFDFRVLKTVLKVGLPFYAANVIAVISSEIDMAMLGSLTSTKELGYFGAASKLVGVFLLFVPVLSSSLTPALSITHNNNQSEFVLLIRKSIRFLMVLSFPLSLAMTLFPGEIATILYGKGFEPSHKIIAYLSPTLILTYLATLLSSGLSISRSGHTLAVTVFAGVLINVSLNSLTIPIGLNYWGVGGGGLAVTISTVISEFVVVIMLLFFFPRKLLTLRLISQIFLLEIPIFFSLYFFDWLYNSALIYRVLVFLSTPLYLFSVGAINKKDIMEVVTAARNR